MKFAIAMEVCLDGVTTYVPELPGLKFVTESIPEAKEKAPKEITEWVEALAKMFPEGFNKSELDGSAFPGASWSEVDVDVDQHFKEQE